MKPTLTLTLIALLLGSITCHAQWVDSSSTGSGLRYISGEQYRIYVPVKAWRKLRSAVPSAGIIRCVKSDSTDKILHSYIDITYYYSIDSTTYSGVVIMDSAYNILKNFKGIPIHTLPKTITNYISEHFKGGTYDEGEGCTWNWEGGKESYFISINLHKGKKYCNLTIDAQGKVLKKEMHTYIAVRM